MPSYGKFKFNVTNSTAANTTLTTQAKGMQSPLPKGAVEGDNETVATTVLSEKGTTTAENVGKTAGDGITKSVENVTPSGASAAEEETSKGTTVADDIIKNGTTGLTGTTKIGTADVDDVTLKRTTTADDLVKNETLKTPGAKILRDCPYKITYRSLKCSDRLKVTRNFDKHDNIFPYLPTKHTSGAAVVVLSMYGRIAPAHSISPNVVCLSYIYIPLKQRSAVIGGDLLAAWIPLVPIFPSFPFLLSSGGSLKGQPRKNLTI